MERRSTGKRGVHGLRPGLHMSRGNKEGKGIQVRSQTAALEGRTEAGHRAWSMKETCTCNASVRSFMQWLSELPASRSSSQHRVARHWQARQRKWSQMPAGFVRAIKKPIIPNILCACRKEGQADKKRFYNRWRFFAWFFFGKMIYKTCLEDGGGNFKPGIELNAFPDIRKKVHTI